MLEITSEKAFGDFRHRIDIGGWYLIKAGVA